MSMLKRVARAIAGGLGLEYDSMLENKQAWTKQRGADYAGVLRDINEPFRDDIDDAARAALQALAELDAGAHLAGERSANEMADETDDQYCSPLMFRAGWQAAIKHILDEGRT